MDKERAFYISVWTLSDSEEAQALKILSKELRESETLLDAYRNVDREADSIRKELSEYKDRVCILENELRRLRDVVCNQDVDSINAILSPCEKSS